MSNDDVRVDIEVKVERAPMWHVWLVLFWGIIFFLLIWDDMNRKEQQIKDFENEHCYESTVQMPDSFADYPDETLVCKNYTK